MKTLIHLNLLLVLRLKNLLITTVLFIVLALAQVNFLHVTASAAQLSPNLWDYLVISSGGLFAHDHIWKFIGWFSMISPIFFYLYDLTGVTGGFDTFVLTRIKSRQGWWGSKIISTAIIVILYCTWYLFVHLIVGFLFFPAAKSWSSFAQSFYLKTLKLQFDPPILMMFIFLILVTGMIAISIFSQMTSLIFKNSVSFHIIITIIILILGVGSLRGIFLREFSPVMFPSFFDMFQDGIFHLSVYWNQLLYNFIFAFACFIISSFLIHRYPFVSND